MTRDYVDAVLFQLRWETIADRDGYFMGLYDDPESSDYVSDDAEYGTELTVCDCGTQTPKVWLCQEADKRNQVSSIYTPLVELHKNVQWTEGALDAVALAMQGWRGDGSVAGLCGHLLAAFTGAAGLACQLCAP